MPVSPDYHVYSCSLLVFLLRGLAVGVGSLFFVVLVYQGLYLVPPLHRLTVGSLSYVAFSLNVMVRVVVVGLVSLEFLNVACHPCLLPLSCAILCFSW